MFDYKSRYYQLPQLSTIMPDGRVIAYVSRRFLPQREQQTYAGQVTVGAADRLDLIAARIYGDPLRAWQLCDANETMDPFDLICPGKIVKYTSGTA